MRAANRVRVVCAFLTAGFVASSSAEAQTLRFLHSEVVRQVEYAAGGTDVAIDSRGTVYVLYEDLLDTIPNVFSTGLRYAVRKPPGAWSFRTLVSMFDASTHSPRAVAQGKVCHFFWTFEDPDGHVSMRWARAQGDSILSAHALLDTCFDLHVDAVRFGGKIIASGFELRLNTPDWGPRLFEIRGDQVSRVSVPFGSRWGNLVLAPAGKQTLYVAGQCAQAACLARANSDLTNWQQIGLGTCERADGLRLCTFGGRVFLFWELGRGGAFFPDELRWLSVQSDGSVAGPETLRDVEPPTFLFDPEVIAYRDRWVLLIVGEGRFSDRSAATHYAIYDGDRWTEFRPFVPDSGFVVGNVSATVDETGLIRFAYSGGDGERQIVGYATARVEFPSSAERVEHETPEDFGLQAPHPNPFNRATEVRFSLARPRTASLCVVDVRGRVVRRLGSGRWAAGPHALRWDGTNDRGEPLPTGVYIVRLEAGDQVATRKLVLVR